MLLLGITVIVVTATVAVGAVVLSDRQADADLRSAETSLTNFASQTALVSSGASDSRSASIPGGRSGTTTVDPDAGHLRVELRDEAGDLAEDGVLLDRSLGRVTYARAGETVAYEGGGVWRGDGETSRMVSPPPVHYRGTTFTMPIPFVESGNADGGRATVTRAGPATPVYPVPNEPDRRNPLSAATVHVVVESDYYLAWGRFFEARTGGTVAYDHAAERVTLRLATDDPDRRIDDAAVGTATDRFEVIAAAGSPAFVDGYNSTVGPYDETEASVGHVSTVGDLRLRGAAEIRGDVNVGGSVDLGGGSRVTGNAAYGDGVSLRGNSAVDGWTAANASVAQAAPIDSFIHAERTSLLTDNDNAGTAAIDGTTFNETRSTLTLAAGQYYLDDATLDGRTLRLDVSDGDVRLAVDGDLSLSNDRVRVVGDGGSARVFVTGDIEVTDGSEVTTPGDEATRLWVYGSRNAAVEVNDATFTGVVYAPSDARGTGTVRVRNGGTIKGAVVGGETVLRTGGTVHYDRALTGQDPLFGADLPRVTFLHVTGTPVVVADG
ncbi:hypothetical protein JCM17823_08490 [Halorubrum gandharaense]